MKRVRRVALWLLLGGCVAYGVVLVLFALFQRSLLYFPTPRSPADEQRIADARGFESIPARGDAHAIFHVPHPEGAEATLVVAHGNAGSALTCDHFIALARGQTVRYDLLLVEYPGYGSRRGEPTQAGYVDAVVDAIDHAARLGKPVVLLGESLGSAVVSLAAARRRSDVAAVILTTPLPRLALVAKHHYPFVPTFLLVDRYEADTAIARFGGPVAFIVAAHDEVVPAPFGLAMYTDYRGPKVLVVDPDAAHDTVDYAPDGVRMRRVFKFVADAIRAERP